MKAAITNHMLVSIDFQKKTVFSGGSWSPHPLDRAFALVY